SGSMVPNYGNVVRLARVGAMAGSDDGDRTGREAGRRPQPRPGRTTSPADVAAAGPVRFERRIPFERLFNFRDVGGYLGVDGRTVRWRRLFRSDALSGLTEADRERFLGLGVRTVVDLRRPYEIAQAGRVPGWDGLTYRHL